jgi:ankyrin repeat protein
MIASWYGRDEAFDLLLKAGADPSMRSRGGSNALHFAASRLNERPVRLLLEAGVDVCTGDNFGRTPLHNAIKRVFNDNKEVVRMLKEAEASSRHCSKLRP